MPDKPSGRWTLPLAVIGTVALLLMGLIIAEGSGESALVGIAAVLGAILVALVSPAAGIAGVLLAAPTMYDLFPMPRGTFSLLELALTTATAGIALRLLLNAVTRGWSTLADVLRPAQLIVPVGMLVLATAITMVTLAEPDYRTESLREVRTVIVEPLLFLAVARLAMRDRLTRNFAGWMLVLGGSAVAGYALVQIVFDLGGVEAGSVTRATATYSHPNNLALFLERTVLLTLGVGIVRPRWWPVWMLTAIQLAGLALTFSRGALIAVVFGVALLFLLRGMLPWLLLLIAGGIGAVGAGSVLFPDRFIDAGGAGVEPTRFTIWRASWRMIVDHPFFGVGPDQFLYQYSRRYIEPMGWPERYTSHPHNLVLDVWLRLGIVGLAAAATLVVGMVWWIKQRFHIVRADPWAMGAVAALTGGLAHGMLDNGFFLPDLAVLTWFLLAMIVTVQGEGNAGDAVQPPVLRTSTWPQPHGEAKGFIGVHRTSLQTGAYGLMIFGFAVLPFVTGHHVASFGVIAAAGLTTIMRPALGLAILIATIPLQDEVLLPFVRGELTLTQVALFGLVLGWFVTIYRQRIWLDAIVVGFLCVFAAFSISLVEADDIGLWAAEVYRWFAAGAVYVIARSVLITWKDIRITLYGIAVGVFLGTYFVIEQFYQQANSDAGVDPSTFRAMGAFGVPNPLAASMEFSLPVLLIFGLLGIQGSVRERIGTKFWVTSLLASGPGLVIVGLTQSRGGYIGMAVALLIVWLRLPNRARIGSLLVGIVVAGSFLVTSIGQAQLSRFTDALDDSQSGVRAVHGGTLGRESLWKAGIAMMEDKPLTGIGAGEYDYHYREYVPEWIDRFPRGQAHNGWLQMGAQAGIPGLIALSIWLAASLASLWGAARRATNDLGRMLAWGGIAVLVAFSLHSLVDYLNVLSLGIQLSVVTAIGLALSPDPLPSLQRHSERACEAFEIPVRTVSTS